MKNVLNVSYSLNVDRADVLKRTCCMSIIIFITYGSTERHGLEFKIGALFCMFP